MSDTISKEPTLLRLGTIESVSFDDNKVVVNLILSKSGISGIQRIETPIPVSYYSVNGMYINSTPKVGTGVIVGRAESGSWYILTTVSVRTSQLPEHNGDSILLFASADNFIEMKKDGTIFGNDRDYLQIDSKRKIQVNTLDTHLNFTEASRSIEGIIKRELNPNINITSSARLSSNEYDDFLKTIAMDPTASPAIVNTPNVPRNLPLVEKRELVYEFAYSYQYSNDVSEGKNYEISSLAPATQDFINRREGRADTLSLSLVAPNYLIEKVEGTLVDSQGNILDLNRAILPIGKDKKNSLKQADNKADAFTTIRELSRKSIAYHFEINTRKKEQIPSLEVSSINENYARSRSRFFLDIDKEGLFKLNVPASSETGNVPLLARYENYSTLSANQNSDNPNKLIFNNDNQDIYHDSFGHIGNIIQIKDDGGVVTTPLNGDTGQNIKHGTVFHDISKTIEYFQTDTFRLFESQQFDTDVVTHFSTLTFPKDIVSLNIINSGDNANAGGRSGQMVFDGSLELNVGANTVDRQSIWVDAAGGSIFNLGRDLNNISLAARLDGDMFVQIGGAAVGNDSRFYKLPDGTIRNNAARDGALDIRVNNGSEVTIVRIDKFGVSVATPNRCVFQSNQAMVFKSGGDLHIDAENVYIQNRLVNKNVAGSM